MPILPDGTIITDIKSACAVCHHAKPITELYPLAADDGTPQPGYICPSCVADAKNQPGDDYYMFLAAELEELRVYREWRDCPDLPYGVPR